MSKPLVSIIIPTFNRGHLLAETLESIQQQTYPHWECLVIDDGSTDNTPKVLQTFIKNDPRFSCHLRPKNRLQGGNAARNYGLEISKGDYIQWFDSDDLMQPKLLEYQINAIKENKVEFSVCLLDRYNEDFSKLMVSATNNTIEENLYYDFLLKKNKIALPTVMFTKKILFNYTLNETIYKSQEYDFFSRFLKENYDKGFLLNLPLVKIRRHEESITGTAFVNDSKKLDSVLKTRYNSIRSLPSNTPHRNKVALIAVFYEYLGFAFKNKSSKILCKYLIKSMLLLKIKSVILNILIAIIYVFYVITNRGYESYKNLNRKFIK